MNFVCWIYPDVTGRLNYRSSSRRGECWQASGRPDDKSSRPAGQDARASESGAFDRGCDREPANYNLVGAALWCTSMLTDFFVEGHSWKVLAQPSDGALAGGKCFASGAAFSQADSYLAT